MRVVVEKAIDKRTLIKTYLSRETPEKDGPEIEVVFHLRFSEDFRLADPHPGILIQLSATRTDTREAVLLTEEEKREVEEAAGEKAASLTQEVY